ALVQDADAIDQRILAGKEGRQPHLVVDGDVDEADLADIALELEKLGVRRMPAADGENLAALGQVLDDIAADEPGSAENRDLVRLHDRGLANWVRLSNNLTHLDEAQGSIFQSH